MYSKQNSETIKELFDSIAPNYDKLNNIISFGLHNRIKKKSIALIPHQNYSKIIDLCTGTGDIAKLLAQKFPGSQILATDFSLNMLNIAKEKLKKFSNVSFEQIDNNNLPPASNTFDLCTVAFGLRNMKDINKALSDIFNILNHSGCLMILEAVRPEYKKINPADYYFKYCMPYLASLSGGEKKAYEYLAGSRNDYPTHKEIQSVLLKHNFEIILQKQFCFSMFSLSLARKKIKFE